MQSIDYEILVKIKIARRGSLFFTEDFLSFGAAKAVAKALERLIKKVDIIRVSRGIYARQAHDPLLDKL